MDSMTARTCEEGFRLKRYRVVVDGEGYTYVAASPGKALSDAWSQYCCYRYVSFKDFLKMARVRRDEVYDTRFGDEITLNDKPVYFVSSNRQYVQIAWPGGDTVSNAHPLEIKPISYRPETYRSEKFDAI